VKAFTKTQKKLLTLQAELLATLAAVEGKLAEVEFMKGTK
jgi:hypothetical protein